jgi:hypothetical protein
LEEWRKGCGAGFWILFRESGVGGVGIPGTNYKAAAARSPGEDSRPGWLASGEPPSLLCFFLFLLLALFKIDFLLFSKRN